MQKREIEINKKKKAKVVTTDVDTQNQLLIGSSDKKYFGRKEIIINVSQEEFLNDPINIIQDNMDMILSIHKENVRDMNYLQEYMKGNCDILNKTRANGDTKINNKHVTNYAWEFVNFKKGYYVGKPIKYVDLEEETTEDIKYFNRYIRDVNKASKDLTKYENMLVTGIAYTMTIPRKSNYNLEYESPFTYEVLQNSEVCVVRSNDIFKTKLFTMCITNVNDVQEYTVYYEDLCLIFSGKDYTHTGSYHIPISNPITEYQLNNQRMGVFEVVLNSLNSLNKITSNQLDQQEEAVNNYLTFENVNVENVLENAENFRRKRIIAVNTIRPETPAKIGSINLNNDDTSVNNKYNEIEQRTYDIVGVPKPTSSTGQGVSGEAQVYGGGWENAQTIALLDTNYISKYENEDLKKFIYISKEVPGSKTNNLIPTNIEIKYTINKSNNMMVKAQSLKYFLDAGFTREQALTYCEITDDPQHDGSVADLNEDIIKEKEIKYEVEKTKALQSIKEEQPQVEEPQEDIKVEE